MDRLVSAVTGKNIQGYIEGLLGAHQLLDCFQNAKHICVTLTISGIRPLHIEKCENHVRVAQYARVEGETIPDPEICFQIDSRGRWFPVEAHFANGGWSNSLGNSWLSNMREHAYIQALADRWVRQLEPMRYDRGEVSQIWGENK